LKESTKKTQIKSRAGERKKAEENINRKLNQPNRGISMFIFGQGREWEHTRPYRWKEKKREPKPISQRKQLRKKQAKYLQSLCGNNREL
jgi:hypothetical protein